VQRIVGLLSFLTGIVLVSAVFAYTDARAFASPAAASSPPVRAAAPAPSLPVETATPDPSPVTTPRPAPTPTVKPPVHPAWTSLSAAVQALVAASGGTVGVELIELGGKSPSTWALAQDSQFSAASDYKLVALMAEAQGIAAGRVDPRGIVCFLEEDYEDGWFSDYEPGACFTRSDLAARAGLYSDNTAGHMLVRDLGGSAALNAFARRYGATGSDLFDANTTTAHDLAVLWAAEATGRLGGQVAQAWLYPVLTNSRYEAGIPAGLPAGLKAIHKTGELDLEVNDAALVNGAPNGAYVLVVLTDNAGDAAGWDLIARISAAVARYEAAR